MPLENTLDGMADNELDSQVSEIMSNEYRETILSEDYNPIALIERIYQLWWRWADFHLHIITPYIAPFPQPVVIPPEPISGTGEMEFVYPILDHGDRFSTSKGSEMFAAGMSMAKLHMTIEKIIVLLMERLKASGTSPDTEVRVAFAGHELAQRKAFEVIINLPDNVVVTNFDPGIWGERYLETVKRIADKGYGYPSEAPRDTYRQARGTGASTPSKQK